MYYKNSVVITLGQRYRNHEIVFSELQGVGFRCSVKKIIADSTCSSMSSSTLSNLSNTLLRVDHSPIQT